MTWVAIDDRATSHPKLLRVGPEGVALWLAGLCYCNAFATNGRIEKLALGGLYPPLKRPQNVAKLLVSEGLWEDQTDHWDVHDYEHYQAEAMKDEAEARKEKARVKKRNQRASRKMSPGDTGGQNSGTNPGTNPGTNEGTSRGCPSPPARPGPTNLLAEVGTGGQPPPDPVTDQRDPELLFLDLTAQARGRLDSVSASPRTKARARALIDQSKATATENGWDWKESYRLIFNGWVDAKDSRINLPNWPEKLLEDWHVAVAAVAE